MFFALLPICFAVILETTSAQYRGVAPLPMAPIPESLPNGLAYTLPQPPIAGPLPNNLPLTPIAPILEPIPQCVPDNAAVFNGGGFTVTSYSSVGPTGIKVQSDNLAVEGPLSVTGKLPFLGVVTVEGPLPAVGQGAVAYECGKGDVGIITEGILGDNIGVPPGLGYEVLPNGMPYRRY